MAKYHRLTARRIRQESADLAYRRPHPALMSNGEEETYLNRIANFTKGLPHNYYGEVDATAYNTLLKAMYTGDPAEFERIPLGEPDGVKLTNPQGGLAFDLQGPDARAVTLPPAPCIDDAEVSGEMAELYWMALLRDVPFYQFETHGHIARAASHLSSCSVFKGPKRGGRVTPATIFRGATQGDLIGPFVSQFLLRDVPLGALTISQALNPAKPGVDYLMDYAGWLQVQNGQDRRRQDKFENTQRYIRTMRDLTTYVHFDTPYQAYQNACLMLLAWDTPLDSGNPYVNSHTQAGYGTFGGPHVLGLLSEVATRALKAVWWQKWGVHRRLRPEAFAGLIHNHLTTSVKYPLHHEILAADILVEVYDKYGTYLLPQAYPEGCPPHPAYGAGHAAVAGACITLLKAWFDETALIPRPVVPSHDGCRLDPYTGAPVTVRDELNKLAGNMALGRVMAGVNWRSDYTEAMRLGETVAICLLEEQQMTYNEEYEFTFTKFDGSVVTLAKPTLLIPVYEPTPGRYAA